MRKVLIFFALVAVLGGTQRAHADDDDLRLMRQPNSYVDVIDAFDDEDPFDLNISAEFHRSFTQGTIEREAFGAFSPATGRDSREFMEIADYEHLRNELEIRLDIGLFRDFAVYARLPIVLSDTQKLLTPSGTNPDGTPISRDAINANLTLNEPGAGDVPIFSVPFVSPERSGLDYLAVGLAIGIFNQNRTRELPTWILLAEGQFGIGDTMQACNPAIATGPGSCSDVNEGVSRGTHGLKLETRLSRRYRYAEPYSGLSMQIEWPGTASNRFLPSGDLSGFMNTRPPILGEFTAGMAIVPWEHRGRWQRFTVDFRFHAQYISEGREYSPLFDALGSSQSGYFTQSNCEGIPRNGTDCNDAAMGGLRLVEFTGLTDVEAHGNVGGRIAIEMQAAQYVRFAFGVDVSHTTSHLLTFADACNPNVDPQGADDPRAGRCRGGIINPHHRIAVDLPGNRFRLDGATTLDIFASATAQF